MAVLHPRLDPGPRPAAATARLRAFPPGVGPFLGRGHRFHHGRFGVHRDVGDGGRQPVLRRASRSAARHPVPSLDRASFADAAVVHHEPVRYGKHRYRKCTAAPFGTSLPSR